MLSSVAKLADKAFVMGFLLPALLAVFATVKLFGCAQWFSALCTINEANPFENLTYLGLVVWFLAVLLLTLNFTAYRVLEGYLPPVSWLTSVRRFHQERFQALTDERLRLRAEGKKPEGSRIRLELLASYPPDTEHVLPTAFGNAIRAFEFYPAVYGADSISVWTRLGAVVPASFQGMINDARSQIDFLVNVCLLSLVVAIIAVVRLGAEFSQPNAASLPPDRVYLLTIAGVALVVAAVAYRWAVGRIAEWGELVKSAFDCYLPALAAKLGYALPETESKRREFWTDMSKLFLYREQLRDGKWNLLRQGADGGSGDGGGTGRADPEKDEAGGED